MDKLQRTYYLNNDVLFLAKDLLGKVICSNVNGAVAKAVITETEAYAGEIDKASHAYGGRRTNRTEVMYGTGGVAYVYLCYGIHHLFNVVTNRKNTPHAVLVRGAVPIANRELVQKRRKKSRFSADLLSGPGCFSQGMGISTDLNQTDLLGNTVWIEQNGFQFETKHIRNTPRIGVDYAGDHARWLYRFYVPPSTAQSLIDAQGN